jgi:choline dehydrogenase-like flavoprotein
MAYLRGSSEDWDRYASITGDEGWSWDAIQPYIRKVSSTKMYLTCSYADGDGDDYRMKNGLNQSTTITLQANSIPYSTARLE